MAVQMVKALKLLVAITALVRTIFAVGRQMLVEGALVRKGLLALWAYVLVPLADSPRCHGRPRSRAATH
jgi:hypothetical protein